MTGTSRRRRRDDTHALRPERRVPRILAVVSAVCGLVASSVPALASPAAQSISSAAAPAATRIETTNSIGTASWVHYTGTLGSTPPYARTAPTTRPERSGSVPWSQGWQEHIYAYGVGQQFSMTFSVDADADYALAVQMTRANHFGELQFEIDHKVVLNSYTSTTGDSGTPLVFNGYAAAPAIVSVPLGGVHLAPPSGSNCTGGSSRSTHVLSIDVIGTDPRTTQTGQAYGDGGFSAGIDFLDAVPINNATACSFETAKNNHGYSTDNRSNVGSNLDSYGNSLSRNALGAAITAAAPGSALDPFGQPAANSAGYDNVVALGQTIRFTPARPVEAVGSVKVLVAATFSGGTPAVGSGSPAFSLNYLDSAGHPVSRLIGGVLPSIPNWVNGGAFTQQPGALSVEAVSPAVAYYNHGAGSARVNARISLFVVTINSAERTAGDTLYSITLPTVGTDSRRSGASALHILGIAVAP